MNKIVNVLKKYMYVVAIFIVVSIILGVSYSNFIVTSNNHKAAEMYIGALKYSIEIDENSTNTLTIPMGETIIDVKVSNLNPVDTYYKLLYLKNANLTVEYLDSAYELDDSNNITKSYDKPNDLVTSSNSKTIKLQITNNSTSSQTLGLSVKGGYITNTLSDIAIPSNYSEIASINTKASTYFCKTNDTLTQGLKYVNGQYTYAYEQRGYYASSGLGWSGISNNGWGVQLTDKTSTDTVTSKVCTYINNKPITLMSYMFYNSQATALDLSSFNTSNVTDMNSMFSQSKVTALDLSSFDTSKVIYMSSMFSSSKATTLDLSNFDTSNVTDMYKMFSFNQATTLDVSNFNTSKVTDMRYMFNGSQATVLDLSNFDTSKVTSMSYMFYNSQATVLNLSNFDTSNVTNMYGMFFNSKATTLDLSNFDTSKVIGMSYMFNGSQATTIDVSSFNTSKVTSMSSMFMSSKATTLDVSNFDTSKVTDMSGMFYNSQATILDLSNFNTSNVTNMNQMFSYSSSLKTIYVSNKFNTDAVTNSTNMFRKCTSLVGGSGTVYNSTKVDKTYACIDGGTSSPGYFTDVSQKPSTFDTDDWATIVKSVKEGNTRKYKVGDTKTIDMGSYGTHTLRIANTSTPSECSTSGFSQTACGFVLEFADIITTHNMNDSGYNNGWSSSSMRTFVNNDIYNALPSDLKNGIINTTVISGYNSSSTTNLISNDKLYLLSTSEVWTQGTSNKITNATNDSTRQLDYYKNLEVSTTKGSGAIKKNGTDSAIWWLRTSTYYSPYSPFVVFNDGSWASEFDSSYVFGVSPAFRIG